LQYARLQAGDSKIFPKKGQRVVVRPPLSLGAGVPARPKKVRNNKVNPQRGAHTHNLETRAVSGVAHHTPHHPSKDKLIIIAAIIGIVLSKSEEGKLCAQSLPARNFQYQKAEALAVSKVIDVEEVEKASANVSYEIPEN